MTKLRRIPLTGQVKPVMAGLLLSLKGHFSAPLLDFNQLAIFIQLTKEKESEKDLPWTNRIWPGLTEFGLPMWQA